MARKKKSDDGGGGSGDWLNTYADMVTLLLTFFILLYSMSSMDAAKFDMLVAAFASDGNSDEKIVLHGEAEGEEKTGAPVPGTTEVESEILDLDDIYTALEAYIEEKSLQDSVQISQGEGYVFIRFMDDMLFEPNSARLKPADLEILNFVGYGIKSVQDKAEMIRIDGHTAAIPEDPNYAVSDRLLSSERSNRVLIYFEDTIGIAPEKLLQAGFGKWKPFVDNTTEDGRQKNRRVEILISGENVISDELDTIYEKLVE